MPVPLLTVYRGQKPISRPKERLGHVSHLRADFAPQGHVFVDKLPHLLSTNEEGFKHFSVAWRQGIRRTDSAWIMLLCDCGSLNLSRASYVGSFPYRHHQLESAYVGGVGSMRFARSSAATRTVQWTVLQSEDCLSTKCMDPTLFNKGDSRKVMRRIPCRHRSRARKPTPSPSLQTMTWENASGAPNLGTPLD